MTPSPDTRARSAPGTRIEVEGDESVELSDGWQAACSAPDAHRDPGATTELEGMAASVPGTAAAALRDAGRWQHGDPRDLDAEDWWFRTSFAARALAPGE